MDYDKLLKEISNGKQFAAEAHCRYCDRDWKCGADKARIANDIDRLILAVLELRENQVAYKDLKYAEMEQQNAELEEEIERCCKNLGDAGVLISQGPRDGIVKLINERDELRDALELSNKFRQGHKDAVLKLEQQNAELRAQIEQIKTVEFPAKIEAVTGAIIKERDELLAKVDGLGLLAIQRENQFVELTRELERAKEAGLRKAADLAVKWSNNQFTESQAEKNIIETYTRGDKIQFGGEAKRYAAEMLANLSRAIEALAAIDDRGEEL
jgi:hypothetical protein